VIVGCEQTGQPDLVWDKLVSDGGYARLLGDLLLLSELDYCSPSPDHDYPEHCYHAVERPKRQTDRQVLEKAGLSDQSGAAGGLLLTVAGVAPDACEDDACEHGQVLVY
jgi:hypothetical protein